MSILRNAVASWIAGILLLAGGHTSVHAQITASATQSESDLASTPRIEVVSGEAGFDLLDIGPDFSAPWAASLTPDSKAPRLKRRVTTVRKRSETSSTIRMIYRYAPSGRLRGVRKEERTDRSWTPRTRTTYRYDADGTLAHQYRETWTAGSWRPVSRRRVAYNAEGRIMRVTHQTRKQGRWHSTARLLIADLGEGKRRILHEVRDAQKWSPMTRVTFNPSGDGRRITQRNETWTGRDWENSARLAFTYDVTGRPVEEYTELWTGQRWAEGPHRIYTHALRGPQVEQRIETWIGTTKVGTIQTELTYAAALPEGPRLLDQLSSE